VGGTSRVYKLGKLDKVAIKIPYGGRHVLGEVDCKCQTFYDHSSVCKKLENDKQKFAYLEVLYNWASNTSIVVGRLCREHLNGLLLDEYEHLREMNKLILAKGILPQVYSFHLSEIGLCYYTMERFEGVSLRKLMKSTNAGDRREKEIEGSPDYLPAFMKILTFLIQLNKKFNHCDLKPDNIIVNIEGGTPTFKLIDPLPKERKEKYNFLVERWDRAAHPIRSFLTVAYNPKAYMGPVADSFGMAVILLEMATDKNPFSNYERKTWSGEEDSEHPLEKTLHSLVIEYKKDQFVSWTLEWMIKLANRHQNRANPLSHAEMLQNLQSFSERGLKLTRIPKNK